MAALPDFMIDLLVAKIGCPAACSAIPEVCRAFRSSCRRVLREHKVYQCCRAKRRLSLPLPEGASPAHAGVCGLPPSAFARFWHRQSRELIDLGAASSAEAIDRGPIRCPCPGCDFEAGTLSDVVEHSAQCPGVAAGAASSSSSLVSPAPYGGFTYMPCEMAVALHRRRKSRVRAAVLFEPPLLQGAKSLKTEVVCIDGRRMERIVQRPLDDAVGCTHDGPHARGWQRYGAAQGWTWTLEIDSVNADAPALVLGPLEPYEPPKRRLPIARLRHLHRGYDLSAEAREELVRSAFPRQVEYTGFEFITHYMHRCAVLSGWAFRPSQWLPAERACQLMQEDAWERTLVLLFAATDESSQRRELAAQFTREAAEGLYGRVRTVFQDAWGSCGRGGRRPTSESTMEGCCSALSKWLQTEGHHLGTLQHTEVQAILAKYQAGATLPCATVESVAAEYTRCDDNALFVTFSSRAEADSFASLLEDSRPSLPDGQSAGGNVRERT